MSLPKSNKMINHINWQIKVETTDGRYYKGKMLAFDKHMNLCLGDTIEFRRLKKKKSKGKEECRTLGFVILRGETVLSVVAESSPPPSHRIQQKEGPGIATSAGRGMPVNMSALGGVPVPGVGGPLMTPLPNSSVPPTFGRGLA